MGACIGSFKRKPKKRKRNNKLQRCLYHANGDKVEIDLLMDEDEDAKSEKDINRFRIWTMSGRIPSFKIKRKQSKSGFSKLEKETAQSYDEYTFPRNISSDGKDETQLIPLDAHSLLASRAVPIRKFSCSSSTPPSSIDLEWENEGILVNTSFLKKRLPSCNLEEVSSESGVGGTSPESLEWDPCDPSTTDIETEQLICEIERLTSRVLNETGDWTNRS